MTAGTPHNHTAYVDSCFRCDLSRDETPQGEVVRTPVVPDATTEAPAATPRPAGSDIDSIFESTYNCDSCCQDVVGWDVADFVDFQHVLCSRCVVAQGVAQALDKVNDRVEAAQDAQRGSSLTAVLTATVNAYSVACRDAIAEALDAMEPQTSASTTAAEPQVAPAETQGLRTPVDDATATTQSGGADRVTRPPASGPTECQSVAACLDPAGCGAPAVCSALDFPVADVEVPELHSRNPFLGSGAAVHVAPSAPDG